MKNPYLPELAVIQNIKSETYDVATFTIVFQYPRKFSPKPGQFVQVSIFGQGEFPAGISSVQDLDKGIFEITVKRVGKVTEHLLKLKPGSNIGIRGPFGNGYPVGKMEGKDIYLVAGGTGITSIRYLAQYLLDNKEKYGQLKLMYGANNPGELIYKDSFLAGKGNANDKGLDICLTVDKGGDDWQGDVGVVCTLLDDSISGKDDSYMVVCGPNAMMKAVIDIAEKAGFDDSHVVMSFERRMQCGVGICGHCMIGDKRVCLNGPAFFYSDVKDSLDRLF